MRIASHKPVVLVTAADLAPQALEMLAQFDVVFAGKQPTEDDIVALCIEHKPVAIIVRYGKINARIMDAAENLQVISKHGSGIDVIDQDAAVLRKPAGDFEARQRHRRDRSGRGRASKTCR